MVNCTKWEYKKRFFIDFMKNIETNLKLESGKTSLMYAAIYGHLETVKVLLENGVKTEKRDDNGELHIFFKKGI